jgi:hypothetical protein
MALQGIQWHKIDMNTFCEEGLGTSAALLPVAVVCLGWLLIAGFDAVHLSGKHLLHLATLTIKLSNSVVDLGFDLVATGDSGVLDCGQLLRWLIHDL